MNADFAWIVFDSDGMRRIRRNLKFWDAGPGPRGRNEPENEGVARRYTMRRRLRVGERDWLRARVSIRAVRVS